MKYSVVIPIYRNAESIPRLLAALEGVSQALQHELEVVFVVDGSPDNSLVMLRDRMNTLPFPVQLLAHSRNFGSFAAIRTGLQHARGHYFGVMAADLQEPPDLLIRFFTSLAQGECDVAIGTRDSRDDPFLSKLASTIFWTVYQRLVMKDMPKGGVDIFGCNTRFRDQLMLLEESRSSLIAQVFWLGFRRKHFNYHRMVRLEGTSAWTFRKKVDYMLDSIYAFTDFPIRFLFRIGVLGILFSTMMGTIVLIARIAGKIPVPGYVATILVILFFGALNLLGFGIVGNYAWRAYENTKRRPNAVISVKIDNTLN